MNEATPNAHTARQIYRKGAKLSGVVPCFSGIGLSARIGATGIRSTDFGVCDIGCGTFFALEGVGVDAKGFLCDK